VNCDQLFWRPAKGSENDDPSIPEWCVSELIMPAFDASEPKVRSRVPIAAVHRS